MLWHNFKNRLNSSLLVVATNYNMAARKTKSKNQNDKV